MLSLFSRAKPEWRVGELSAAIGSAKSTHRDRPNVAGISIAGIHDRVIARVLKAPLVIVTDGDIGKLLGRLLQHERNVDRDIVSIDSIQLQELDYLDTGEVIMPANVVRSQSSHSCFRDGV